MANTAAQGGDAISATQFNTIVVGDTAPSAPAAGDVWVDTSVLGGLAKIRGTSAYTVMQPQTSPLRWYQRLTSAQVTNVTDNQTLLSVTGLNIPTTSIIVVKFSVGAINSGGRVGLRLNATIVNTTATLNHYFAIGAGTIALEYLIGRRDAGTTYGIGQYGDTGFINVVGATAAIPSAAITTIDILARGTGASDGIQLKDIDILEIV